MPVAAEEVAPKKAARKKRGKAVGAASSEAPAKRARKDKGKEKETAAPAEVNFQL